MSDRVLCVVGLGQLGSRHLQALGRLTDPVRIVGIDPSDAARATAAARFAAIAGHERHEVTFAPSVDSLPDCVDVAVVATSARERLDVVGDLLHGRTVRYLVLEKVLCQSEVQCRDIQARIQASGARAWVNAPRRMWPDLQRLKTALAGDRILGLYAAGGGWGLACNCYHLLDLLAWLADLREDVEVGSGMLDPVPVASKRPGFHELTGAIAGRFASGTQFLIADVRGTSRPLEMFLLTDRRTVWLDNASGAVRLVAGDANGFDVGAMIHAPYQSELTTTVASSLLERGDCSLTSLGESVALHLPILRAFAPIFGRAGVAKEGVCPIT